MSVHGLDRVWDEDLACERDCVKSPSISLLGCKLQASFTRLDDGRQTDSHVEQMWHGLIGKWEEEGSVCVVDVWHCYHTPF